MMGISNVIWKMLHDSRLHSSYNTNKCHFLAVFRSFLFFFLVKIDMCALLHYYCCGYVVNTAVKSR